MFRKIAIPAALLMSVSGCLSEDPTDTFIQLAKAELEKEPALCQPVGYEGIVPVFPLDATVFGRARTNEPSGDSLETALTGFADNLMAALTQHMTARDLLRGMNTQGLIEVTEETKGWDTVTLVHLSDTGAVTDFWDDTASQICVGKVAFGELVRFTYDDNGQNENAAQVDFTWSIETEEWVNKEAFSSITGIAAPAEASFFVVKSSDGWRIADNQAGS